MEDKRPFIVLWVGIGIVFFAELASLATGKNIIGFIGILTLCALLGFIPFGLGSKTLAWIMAGFIFILIAGSGASLIQIPIPKIDIHHDITYVEAPGAIDDPALREYETAKVGFQSNWAKNVFIGGYLLWAFCFAFAQLISIVAQKRGAVVLYFPIDIVTFVLGVFFIRLAVPPPNVNPATVEYEQMAVLVGAIGPFIWSTALQYLRMGAGATKSGADRTGNVWLIVIVATLAYPLLSGLSNLLDFNLIKTMIMAKALTNSAVTLQRWTEMELVGKFAGMFIPASLGFCWSMLKALVRKLLS